MLLHVFPGTVLVPCGDSSAQRQTESRSIPRLTTRNVPSYCQRLLASPNAVQKSATVPYSIVQVATKNINDVDARTIFIHHHSELVDICITRRHLSLHGTELLLLEWCTGVLLFFAHVIHAAAAAIILVGRPLSIHD